MKELDQKTCAEGISKEGVTIIDVRTPEEWEDGVIPGAKLLNIFDAQGFMAGISEMEKNGSYYVYCRSGGRSGQACQIMSAQGFKNLNNLTGGFSEWSGEVHYL